MRDKAAFSGGLSFISLSDLFQILGGNNATGRLQITSQYAPAPGMVYFVNGNPVNAAIGPLQGLEAIYALFGWSEGEFQFNEERVQVERLVKNSWMQIVLDALRLLDDGEIKNLGPALSVQMPMVRGGGPTHDERDSLPFIRGPLVDYAYVLKEEEFHDGDTIVTEGGYGSWIWIILEGKVKIMRETSGGPMAIARLGQGCFIGTFTSLLFSEYARSATVQAVGEVRLGLLDTLRLSGEYSSLSTEFRKLLISLAGRLTKITDRALDAPNQKSLNTVFRQDKELIIEKGSSKEEIFTIAEGESYVISQTSEGHLPLLTLHRDDVFGHMPFIDIGHEPRYASVFGSKDLKVNKLDMDKLRKEYDQLSEVFRHLIDNVSNCISVTTKTARHLN
jgi:CRP-like cAMP-binding protein